MKLKKVFAGIVAAALACSTVAISAFAYEENDAHMMYADVSWGVSAMDDNQPVTVVDKDGTYEVTTGTLAAASGDAGVFCVDIEGLANLVGAGKDAEGYDDCETEADKMAFAKAAGIDVTDVAVSVVKEDGSTADVAVDQSKVIFGDIEGNGKLRIEIFNQYGETKDAAPIDVAAVAGATEIKVKFTITGVGAPEEETPETQAPADDDPQVGETEPAPGDCTGDAGGDDNGNTSVDDGGNNNPGTGVAVAVAPAVLAAGALAAAVVIRKRK